MVRDMVIMCDICGERKASAKCFLCEKDICKDNNFGGDHSRVTINATVYNDKVFGVGAEDKFMDCCPNCTDKLKCIMNKKREILENRIKENLEELKCWMLDEIKKDIEFRQ